MKISNLAKKSLLETKEELTIEKNANMKVIGMEVVNSPQTFEASVTSPKAFEAVVTSPKTFEASVTSPKTFEASVTSPKAFEVVTIPGRAGKSAYDIWLDEGNKGTKADFLSLTLSALRYKGSVDTFADLPTNGNEVGDFWNIRDTGFNCVWNGEGWDQNSGLTDLSNYFNKTEINSMLDEKQDKLVAGENITIDPNTNVISASGAITSFVGTMEEYNVANAAGQIPYGIIVIITEKEEEIPNSSVRTAVLGIAKLGSMILGHQ